MEQVTFFNWVKIRAECTLSLVFKQLRDEIIKDITIRTQCLKDSETGKIGFELKDADAETFIVYRNYGELATGVSFGIIGTELIVIDGKGAEMLRATVGLNNNGRCMLRVNKTDLETWQFRKSALENLFFGP